MTIDKGEIRTSFRLAKDKRKQTSVKPILFNSEMVRAILDGRKTVTRRIVNPQQMTGSTIYPNIDVAGKVCAEIWGNGAVKYIKQPYHRGGILWVRETWTSLVGSYLYRADQKPGMKNPGKWRPSIHMPREAARIWLRVTDVRVERLQDMTEYDAYSEGCRTNDYGDKTIFRSVWDSTIKPADREKYGWAANPWVWVIEFERCEKPEEA